jgi:hypothetical protein
LACRLCIEMRVVGPEGHGSRRRLRTSRRCSGVGGPATPQRERRESMHGFEECSAVYGIHGARVRRGTA